MYNPKTTLNLVKQRLNRLAADTSLDDLLSMTIKAAADYLYDQGINLDGSAGDTMLLVNQAVCMYQQRDQQGGDPEWLRAQRRQRWLKERRDSDDS